ncbi:MAG: hypothetical protein KDB61_11940, partial [Planctomycetes bacterium]|nr:hypothetical protein [Planctomycetota bacterium]
MRSPRTLISLAILLLCPMPLVLGAPQSQKANELESTKEFSHLVEALRGFFADARAQESTGDARARVQAALEELGKEQAISDPLKEVELLGAAVWNAQEHRFKEIRPGKIVELNEPGGSFGKAGLDFALRLPRDFEGKGERHPLILTLPEADQTPAAHLRAAWTNQDVLQTAILVCPAMPDDTKAWDQTMVQGKPGGLSHLFTVLRLVSERFPIDPNRVFVVGRGAGVPAAFAAGKYSPHLFAGIVGIAGEPKNVGPENFRSLPSAFFGGGAEAKAFHEKSLTMGYDRNTLEVSAGEDVIWNWIQNQEREPHPEKIALHTGEAVIFNPSSNRAYWLRLAPIDTGAFA